MMTTPLSEEAFTAIVQAGCPDCQRSRLVVEAMVAQRLPLLAGEPYGSPSWAYKGEDLVRGTYRIACDTCKRELFTTRACPACHAEGRLDAALSSENDFPLPFRCDECGSELLVARAVVPARIMYEGKRAQKAHAEATPEEVGFHAYRVECTRCRKLVERAPGCAACVRVPPRDSEGVRAQNVPVAPTIPKPR